LPDGSGHEAVVGIGPRHDTIGFDLAVTLSVALPGLPEQVAGSFIEEADGFVPALPRRS
jgi:hypothetical protein